MQSKRDLLPLIIVRDLEENHPWLQFWRLKGLPYIINPVLQIVPRKIKNLEKIVQENDFFIFTSSNAVQIFLEQLSLEEDRIFQNKIKICIGKFTAGLLLQKRYENIFIPSDGENSSEGIIKLLKNSVIRFQKGIFLCGTTASTILEKNLCKLNIILSRIEVYEVISLQKDPSKFVINSIRSQQYSYVLFCSGFSVDIFQKKYGSFVQLDTMKILCLGNTTKKSLERLKVGKYKYLCIKEDVYIEILNIVNEIF